MPWQNQNWSSAPSAFLSAAARSTWTIAYDRTAGLKHISSCLYRHRTFLCQAVLTLSSIHLHAVVPYPCCLLYLYNCSLEGSKTPHSSPSRRTMRYTFLGMSVRMTDPEMTSAIMKGASVTVVSKPTYLCGTGQALKV